MNARQLLFTLVLLGAAIGSWWLRGGDGERAEMPGQPAAPPGYYLDDAVLLGTDTAGGRLYELKAEHIREAPESDGVELESIALSFRAAPDSAWQLEAERGRIPRDGSEIELEGAVRASNEAGTALQTERLHITVSERVATTDAPVRLTQGRHALSAVGLRADLKAGSVQLESEVRGSFEP